MNASRRHWLTAALGTTAALALARRAVPQKAQAPVRPIGDEGVGPGEDLMREHGVLNRILLIYDEGIRRTRAHEALMSDALQSAAGIIRRFLEEYHERLEEEHLFPRFERAGRLTELVGVLRAQHQAGRQLTAAILEMSAPSAPTKDKDRAALANRLGQFVRMYRPHEAREDTVLFPAFRDLVSRDEYQRLGEAFEGQETKALGEKGFERIVDEVAGIERALGIYELASFTPSL
jgi:hemerythrin-like domain-containing protein